MKMLRSINGGKQLNSGDYVLDPFGRKMQITAISAVENRVYLVYVDIVDTKDGDGTSYAIEAPPRFLHAEFVDTRTVVIRAAVRFYDVPHDDQTDWGEVSDGIKASIERDFVREGIYDHEVATEVDGITVR